VGPIGFVALVAPQLVRVAAGSPAPPPAASAAGGASLLTWCAVGAAVLPVSVPVGLATAIVGGPVLVVLVLSAARRRGARGPPQEAGPRPRRQCRRHRRKGPPWASHSRSPRSRRRRRRRHAPVRCCRSNRCVPVTTPGRTCGPTSRSPPAPVR